jgi:hypothetical protein
VNGPALYNDLGYEEWFLNGNRHREDGPAIIMPTGRYWMVHGKSHRLDGPAIMLKDGTEHWYLNGILHREDGPALIDRLGNRIWYRYGRIHRLDGPASEWSNGNTDWCINHKSCTTAVKKWLRRHKITLPMNEEAQTLFVLTFVSKYGIPTQE